MLSLPPLSLSFVSAFFSPLPPQNFETYHRRLPSEGFRLGERRLSTSTFSLLRLRPLVAVAATNFRNVSPASSVRGFSTRRTSSSLNDPNPNWSNRPPKETNLLGGCDFKHWLVVMEKPEGDPTRDEICDSYIKTLSQVIGRMGRSRYVCEDSHVFGEPF